MKSLKSKVTVKRIHFLSPNDEFADFENWAFGNLDLSVAKTNDMLEGEYARAALKTRLKAQSENQEPTLISSDLLEVQIPILLWLLPTKTTFLERLQT